MKQSEKYGFPIYEDEDNVELDKYTEELTEKLEDLEDTDREEINNIYKDVQASKIHYETEQAKSLYIDDATDSRGKIKVEGNVEQETREGYNLYDKSKEIVGEAINTTGGIQEIPNWSRSDFIPIESNKEISMTCENKVNGQFTIIEYDSNKTFIKVNAYDFRNSAADNKYTITTTNTTAYVIGQYRNDLNMTNIMIIYGAQNKAYEEYGASPSVDYPSPIKCLGSNINELHMQEKEYTAVGINVTQKESSLQLNGTTTSAANLLSGNFVDIGRFKKGKHILSITEKGSFERSGSSDFSFSIKEKNNTSNVCANITGANLQGGKSSFAFELDEEKDLVIQMFANASNVVFNNFEMCLKVEQGETATSYSPYRTR